MKYWFFVVATFQVDLIRNYSGIRVSNSGLLTMLITLAFCLFYDELIHTTFAKWIKSAIMLEIDSSSTCKDPVINFYINLIAKYWRRNFTRCLYWLLLVTICQFLRVGCTVTLTYSNFVACNFCSAIVWCCPVYNYVVWTPSCSWSTWLCWFLCCKNSLSFWEITEAISRSRFDFELVCRSLF